jgi:hypothetical protein
MVDAPDRIWRTPARDATGSYYCVSMPMEGAAEYVRADLVPKESEAREILLMNLRQLGFRMQSRVERIEERDGENAVTGPGVGISYLFARDIVRALDQAATMLEPEGEP